MCQLDGVLVLAVLLWRILRNFAYATHHLAQATHSNDATLILFINSVDFNAALLLLLLLVVCFSVQQQQYRHIFCILLSIDFSFSCASFAPFGPTFICAFQLCSRCRYYCCCCFCFLIDIFAHLRSPHARTQTNK